MDITRESILGVGMADSMVGLKWLRPNTPYTNDKKEKTNITKKDFSQTY